MLFSVIFSIIIVRRFLRRVYAFCFLNCFSRVFDILLHFLWVLHAIFMKFYTQCMLLFATIP